MPKKATARKKAVSKDQPKKATGPVYQLKITLRDVQPPIWRRLLTKDCTLGPLHDLIQVRMGSGPYEGIGFRCSPVRFVPEEHGVGVKFEEIYVSK